MGVLVATLAALATPAVAAGPRLDYRRLANGFVAETMNAAGYAAGTGFAIPNRWGQYTAYLMATNAAGQRTWRIEHYLPNIGRDTAQGSTIYLLEGKRRALLIDTANPATAIDGVNDLKTVVRYLLAHRNEGAVKPRPLDFVVANTHNHGDHIGENARMFDRTVYYMDLDWPANAPGNYVPIREGGGPTTHGSGQAVSQIDLGGRVLWAIAVPPHTKGSTAYLDAANNMLFTGDALGSAWPFIQGGPLTQYAETVHHVERLTRAYPDIAVLPAHFYQLGAWGRGGMPLDRQYILDEMALADDLVSGKAVGEPFTAGHATYWAKHGTAQIVYSLTTLARPNETLPSAYHAVRLPGGFKREWVNGADQAFNRIVDIKSELYLIREEGGQSLFLLKGSTAALLVGTGSGAPGLGPLVRALIGQTPLNVAVTEGSPSAAAIAQLAPRAVFAMQASDAPGSRLLRDSDTIDLGVDSVGNPLIVEAQAMHGPTPSMALLARGDRLLLAGPAFGAQGDPKGLRLTDPISFQVHLSDWMSRTTGRFDKLLLAGNTQWFISPTYFDQMQQALERVHSARAAAKAELGPAANTTRIVADVDRDGTAIITVPHIDR